MSHRKWTECQNATTMSQVTAPDESIEIVQYTAQCSELSPTSDITKLCCLYLKHVNYYYANNKENPYTNGSTVKKGEKNTYQWPGFEPLPSCSSPLVLSFLPVHYFNLNKQ